MAIAEARPPSDPVPPGDESSTTSQLLPFIQQSRGKRLGGEGGASRARERAPETLLQ